MSKQNLSWGLISTARINRRVIPAIRASRRAELLAVASRSLERARSYAAEWDIPRAHGSYQELLDDPGVDVVYISLPNSLHAQWTVRAVQAGKHVLCEKPLALTTQECDRIITAAGDAGVVVAEAVMYLYHPLLHKARELVREGALGRVRLVRGAFSIQLERPDDVRWKPELGGCALWDLGSYPASFVRWMAGEPSCVLGSQTLSESGVDEAFAGVLQQEGGILGVIDCGFSHQFRVQAEVVGSRGQLEIRRPYLISDESALILRRGFDEEEIHLGDRDPYHCEVESLMEAVLDGSPLPVPLESSRANVATLSALYESARTGLSQPVPGGG